MGFCWAGDDVCDADEARVDVEGGREKVCPPCVDTDWVELRADMREMDRWRAISTVTLLVCEGHRFGMAGTSAERGAPVPADALALLK